MREDLEQVLAEVRTSLSQGEPETLARLVEQVHSADIAEIYTLLDDQERSQLVFLLPARRTAEVIAELDEAERGEAVEDLDEASLTEVLSELAPDDAADILGELTAAQREELLDHIPDEQSDQLEELLGHDEESAGGIMTPDLVAMPESATVAEAIEEVRKASEDEEIHYLYTVDDEGKLVGLVPLRSLVLNPKHTPLSEIAERDPVVVHVNDDQELVANKLRKYDVAAVPVVDDVGELVGQVTYDDVLDVAEEEAAEDLYYMAGTDAAELEDVSAARAAFIRLRWLLACLVGTAFSGLVVAIFKNSFPADIYMALFLFVPMMGAMGGNSGIQTSTIIVRALAGGDLASTKVAKSFAREMPISLIMAPACGLGAALIAALGVAALEHFGRVAPDVDTHLLALSVGLGMSFGILTAGLLGMTLPYVFRRFGVDPAIASGPIVTTANDIVSVTIYFLIGMLIMGSGISS